MLPWGCRCGIHFAPGFKLNLLFSRMFLEHKRRVMLYFKASQNSWLNLIRPSLGCPLRGYNEPGGYDQP
jgi:hypothetical protein